MTTQVSFKERVYNFVAGWGIDMMSQLFPEFFANEPLRPTDRYIEYPFVLSKLPKEKCKILDVGCSGSMFPLLMQALGHNVYGIDIRPCPLDICFVQKDICNTVFKDNTFDIVTAVSTIEHIGLKGRYGKVSQYSDMKAVSEIYRILKENGLLIMTVPFGPVFKETKTHRIYNQRIIDILLTKFTYVMKIVKSPEDDYNLALIRAMK